MKVKRTRCDKTGIDSRLVQMRTGVSTEEVIEVVGSLSADRSVDGILVQRPVPDGVDERAVFEAISPGKDVDGVTMHSFAAMAFGLPGPQSCAPAGIMALLDEYGVDPAGKHAVVIGRSPILDKPIGMLLLARPATVTYCHSRTRGLGLRGSRGRPRGRGRQTQVRARSVAQTRRRGHRRRLQPRQHR